MIVLRNKKLRLKGWRMEDGGWKLLPDNNMKQMSLNLFEAD